MVFESPDSKVEQIPLVVYLYTTLAYATMFIFGYLNEYLNILFKRSLSSAPKKGYAPLFDDFNSFYTRHLFSRVSDCWNRPISSMPGAWFNIVERSGSCYLDTMKMTDKVRKCLNLGSYNYLGFSENSTVCIEEDIKALSSLGPSNCSSKLAFGTTGLHCQLEKTIAEYLSKEDALIFGMGFATNSTAIPALIGKGGLILSDSLNHASLVIGCRSSGATVRVFKHNDIKDLEHQLRIAVKDGQGGPHQRPWQKILIIVEGLYSMEGNIASLKEIINLKKKYKAYLYVDEAHSIGALGKTGRGVCEYWGVPYKDVDVLMGTFTKSFASCGGYIAADRNTINTLRASSFSSSYDLSMSPVCVQQTLTALHLIMGQDGTTNGRDRIESLQRNSIFFRTRLKEKGYKVYGNHDSPVIPVLLYSPMKVAAFSQMCLEKKLAVVVVGYPATEFLMARARFCMSASHTIEDLEYALKQMDAIADKVMIRYNEGVEETESRCS